MNSKTIVAYEDSNGGMWRTEEEATNSSAHHLFIEMLREGKGARPTLFPYLSREDMEPLYRKLKGIYG
jgi:hypothetical protein